MVLNILLSLIASLTLVSCGEPDAGFSLQEEAASEALVARFAYQTGHTYELLMSPTEVILQTAGDPKTAGAWRISYPKTEWQLDLEQIISNPNPPAKGFEEFRVDLYAGIREAKEKWESAARIQKQPKVIRIGKEVRYKNQIKAAIVKSVTQFILYGSPAEHEVEEADFVRLVSGRYELSDAELMEEF